MKDEPPRKLGVVSEAAKRPAKAGARPFCRPKRQLLAAAAAPSPPKLCSPSGRLLATPPSEGAAQPIAAPKRRLRAVAAKAGAVGVALEAAP